MMPIESLSARQIDRFPEFVEKWTDIGLCTAPADRRQAERGIRDAYWSDGRAAPEIVWCGSPLSMGLTQEIVTTRASVAKSVGKRVRDRVWSGVWDIVWNGVWDNVRYSVWSSVQERVCERVRETVWNIVCNGVQARVQSGVHYSGYGQHDAYWLGFYDYFREVCGLVEQTEKLTGLSLIAKSAGWFLPHEHICWVSERHNVLNRDDAGRLHCETGPAISYPDGFSIWALNGVLIDETIVMRPETQTIAKIQGEQNEEIKRIRIERFGWERYMRKVNATPIDRRRNDIDGTLEALYRTDGHSVLVCVCPSTAKVFALGVPNETENCEEAQRYLSSGLNSRVISSS